MKLAANMPHVVILCSLILSSTQLVLADCPLAHTHIGKNPDWRPDDPGGSADDDKLWFFSLPPGHAKAPTPGWPNWGDDPFQPGVPFLKLVPNTDELGDPIWKNGDPGTGKLLWECRFFYSQAGGYDPDHPDAVQHLDGWHSAHGPDGAWDLGGTDPNTVPTWDIGIKREHTSLADPTDFLMIRQSPPDLEQLTADGDTYKFSDYGEKMWLADKAAWGIHSHMGFYFWLPETLGQEVGVAFTAFDDGGMYTPSDEFEFRFVTVPEPGGMVLLLAGLLATRRTK